MKKYTWSLLIGILVVVGCTKSTDTSDPTNGTTPTTTQHSHPHEGPHNGTLIELGEEEFHAELVHNETAVSIYVLDSKATNSVPIDATEVVVNLVHDGKPEQFKLAASPDANDPTGKSSRFVLADKELIEELEHSHGDAKLSLMINGKSYHGSIEHDHGHDGHDHK
jgi:hypothetical protein